MAWSSHTGCGQQSWDLGPAPGAHVIRMKLPPSLSSQGMLLQKPGLVGGSFSLVTWESSRDNWGSDGDL